MRALCWVLILPFILFATVSQGTMLEKSASGGMRIVLCAGDSVVEMILAPDGKLIPADDDRFGQHSDDSFCDWTIHAQPGLDSAPGHEVQASMQMFAAEYAPLPPLHARRDSVLAPSARGPPLPV
ncbi:hypothetical protein [Paracoccus pacificus]|uniref:DUF2946 domain-containing protein n=1 Tax=Paracoccus pacificus TaxID=1463598 RepID=A0ABW4R5V0_9RHOB